MELPNEVMDLDERQRVVTGPIPFVSKSGLDDRCVDLENDSGMTDGVEVVEEM